MAYSKPTLPDSMRHLKSVQDVYNWLDDLRTRALSGEILIVDHVSQTVNVDQTELAAHCENAIAVVASLVSNLYHAGPQP